MKKKILSLLLCITLVLSLLPTLPVLAAETIVFADDFSAYNAGETRKPHPIRRAFGPMPCKKKP